MKKSHAHKEEEILEKEREKVFKSKDISDLTVKVDECDARIKKLIQENYKLREELREEREKNLDIQKNYEKNSEDKAKEVMGLRMKLENEEIVHRTYTTQQATNYDKQLKDMDRFHEEEQKKKQDKINELQEELKDYKDFKENKHKKDAEIQHWQRKHDQLCQEFNNEKFEADKIKAKQINDLKLRYKETVESKEKEALRKALKGIGATEKHIQKQNQQLLDDIILQKNEVEYLKTQEKKLKQENNIYKRDMVINAERVEVYAKRQAEMSKKIKEQKCEIALQKQSLRKTVKIYEREKEIMKHKLESIITEQDLQIKGLKEELKMKNKELRNIKGLAQMILDQRSEVETFFLEALEQIKEEVKRKLLNYRKNKRLAGISGVADPSKTADGKKAYTDKIDLNDLDWEDRERVLRLLFSKMNAGVPPPNWREPLPQINNLQNLQQQYAEMEKDSENAFDNKEMQEEEQEEVEDDEDEDNQEYDEEQRERERQILFQNTEDLMAEDDDGEQQNRGYTE